MDHYYKGRNEEESLTKETVPIPNLPDNFAWSEVTGASRVRTLIGPLSKLLRQEKSLVISGSGPNTTKAVTLAEIIKRRQKQVQERLELGERVVQEFWEPKDEDEGLDSLVVTRRIPAVHILLDINKTSSLSPDEELYNALWDDSSTNQRQEPRSRDQAQPIRGQADSVMSGKSESTRKQRQGRKQVKAEKKPSQKPEDRKVDST